MVTNPSSWLSSPPPGSGVVARAVVFRQPEQLEFSALELPVAGPGEVLVDIHFSGISTGTERLLWTGSMPPFPGMGYPLVPGYESVGRVRYSGPDTDMEPGTWVFVPGANCFGEVRGLFGGSASSLVVPARRIWPIQSDLGERGTLLALAATAHHALKPNAETALPGLIIGHGILGRLMARMVVALGGDTPVVWETQARRRDGAVGYPVLHPDEDQSGPHQVITDASGDSTILDSLMPHLQRGGEVVLAGFYSRPVQFAFPPAFMREARIRIAAEWQPGDLSAALDLLSSGKLSLDGLITHRQPAEQASSAYPVAFEDPDCLKMILEWEGVHAC